ncbi:TetR/AcrR family transcriptional regulator [Paenibacillus silvisoli]|uniref:TetR/AcrR family transcriptional regulator n=1 Tax=Paenibacillus silvisoli TaxID=3110539 RepID=UPI0028063E6D|nr:TetR/AcrR family transcriptional regulator [Paenibacillus silvisoli]
MPKGFSAREKEWIKEKLMTRGRELFCAYGVKKTSISDLTHAAGIAQGTFYSFYSTKEELFFDILEQEEDEVKRAFLEAPVASGNNPKHAISELLIQTFNRIEDNPIFKRLFADDEMENLMRKLPDHKLEAHLRKDNDMLLPVIEKWKRDGVFLSVDSNIVAGVLRSLFLLATQRKQIGAAYHATVSFLIEAVVEQLLVPKSDSHE